MIKLESGKLFSNKTLYYLSPILNSFDKDFHTHWQLIRNSVLCFALQDLKYNDAYNIAQTRYFLFVVLDKYGAFSNSKKAYVNMDLGRKSLQKFLTFFREHDSYVCDYVFDRVKGSTKHCAVISLGEEWKPAYDRFLKGEYSKMFTDKQLAKCRIIESNGQNLNSIYLVLKKDKRYKEIFEKFVEDRFGHDAVRHISPEAEYDFPPKQREEILNADFT